MVIQCSHCPQIDSNQRDHLEHMKFRHFGVQTLRHTCGICQLSLRQTSYERHFLFHHQQIVAAQWTSNSQNHQRPAIRPRLLPSHLQRPGIFRRRPVTRRQTQPISSQRVSANQSISIASITSSSSAVIINYENVTEVIEKLKNNCDEMWMALLGRPKITTKLVGEVSSQQVKIIRSCMDIIKETVAPADYDYIAAEMEDFLKLRNSQYLRIKLLKTNSFYLSPYSYAFSYRQQEENGSLAIKSSNVAVVGLDKTLTMLLSNKKLCESLVFPSKYYDSVDYEHPFCGKHAKKLYEKMDKKDCVLIQLFMDEFCPVNPLGSSTRRNKIMGFYVKILNLPPDLQVLNTIYLCFLAIATDVKNSLQDLLRRLLIPQLQNLFNGVPVYYNGVVKKMPVILHSIVGDNLGVHQLQAFVQSFRGIAPCRFCTVTFENLKQTYTVDPETLKTAETYDAAVSSNNNDLMKEQGISDKCVLNDAPYFHIMDSQLCDIMHDLAEGHLRRLMASVISSLIYDEQIALERINNAIKTFPFRGTMRDNRPSPIVQEHLATGEVKGQTASMMINLMTMLPLILRLNDIAVSSENAWWTTYRAFLKIWNILMMPKITEAQIEYLQTLIGAYLQAFHLNGGHFTVKPHYMLHYPALIRLFGPLFYHWCMRFEGKHKQFKDYAKVNSNCKDLAMTLANRHQMMMVPIFSDMADENYSDLHFKEVAKREYKKDLVIVYGYDSEENKPKLGLIVAADFTNLTLSLHALNVLRFSTDLFAYVVEKTTTLLEVPMKSLLHYKSAALHSDFVRYPYDLQ